MSLFTPPSPVVLADDAADTLPTLDELKTALAPFTVTNFTTGPGKDGWDANSEFDINGSPDGQLHSSVDISNLPTEAGAAGFLQTKLQQLRDGTRQGGFLGDIGPADPAMTFDADEAYWGVYVSPPGAPQQMAVAIHISRWEDQVIATTVMMQANGATLPDSAATTLGAVTGAMIHLMNTD
jgi:hypothetical protein